MGKTKRKDSDYKNFVDTDKNNLIVVRNGKIIEQIKTFQGEDMFVVPQANTYVGDSGVIVKTSTDNNSSVDFVGIPDANYRNAGGTITLNGSVTPSGNGVYVQISGGQQPYQSVNYTLGSATGVQSGTESGGNFGLNANYNTTNNCYEGGQYNLTVNITDANGDTGTYSWQGVLQGTCSITSTTSGGGSTIGGQSSSQGGLLGGATPTQSTYSGGTTISGQSSSQGGLLGGATPTQSTYGGTTTANPFTPIGATPVTPITTPILPNPSSPTTTTTTSGASSNLPITTTTTPTPPTSSTTTSSTYTPPLTSSGTTTPTSTTSTTPTTTTTPTTSGGGFFGGTTILSGMPQIIERETIIERNFFDKNRWLIWVALGVGAYLLIRKKN